GLVSDWSSDVCSSDLRRAQLVGAPTDRYRRPVNPKFTTDEINLALACGVNRSNIFCEHTSCARREVVFRTFQNIPQELPSPAHQFSRTAGVPSIVTENPLGKIDQEKRT